MALTRMRQPAGRMLIVRDITVEQAAEYVGCRPSHLRNVLAGRSHPNQSVREKLPKLIGLPLQALFQAELLEQEHSDAQARRAEK